MTAVCKQAGSLRYGFWNSHQVKAHKKARLVGGSVLLVRAEGDSPCDE